MKKTDVTVYDATAFAHGCLENTTQRQPETVDIFMDDNSFNTPIDIMTQTKELQIIKTMIPYLPYQQQKNMLMLVQLMQFQKTMEVLDNPPAELTAASVSNDLGNKTAMLNSLKKFCSPKEQDTIDSILNILSLIEKENYDNI